MLNNRVTARYSHKINDLPIAWPDVLTWLPSAMNTETKSALWARSLGGRVSSRHWLLTTRRCLPASSVCLYCHMRRRRPHTNQAQPSADMWTLTVVLP